MVQKELLVVKCAPLAACICDLNSNPLGPLTFFSLKIHLILPASSFPLSSFAALAMYMIPSVKRRHSPKADERNHCASTKLQTKQNANYI